MAGINDSIETVDNSDEFLSAVQGDDAVIIKSQSKGGEDNADDLEDDIHNPPIGGDDKDDKVITDAPLSQEDFASVSNEVTETLRTFDDNPSEETKKIKQDMLNLFEGGADIDEDGNIVDKDGKQIASYEDLVNKIGKEEDAIFDTLGNQVDKEGKILNTKHDLDIAENENNALGKELGFEFEDDKGNVKLYKKGTEGLKELVKDIADYQAQTTQENFFNSNPVLREVAKHLLAGGSLDDFQKPVDYSTVDVKKMSLEQKKALVKQSYLAEGLSEVRADNVVQGIETAKLDAQVQEALDVLEAKQAAKEEERSELLQQQEQQRIQDNNLYWKEVESTITKGDLGGFTIPEKEKQDFFRYLAIPVKDGQSQDMIDREKRDLSGELKEAFYRFKGYDVSDVVQEEVSRSNILSLRQKMQKRKELNHDSKPHIKGSIGEISLDTII